MSPDWAFERRKVETWPHLEDGQCDIRRLLIVGAMSVVHWRGRDGGRPGSWLSRMLARKLRMLVAIALANKVARMIWAMLVRNEEYRDPAGAVC